MTVETAHPPANYECFLDQLSSQLSGRGVGKQTRSVVTRGVHHEVIQLLRTFSDFSSVEQVGAARTEEWNPLSQRPVVPERKLQFNELDQDFDSQAEGVRRYISTAHELMHCLLWEPFFNGSFVPLRKTFSDISLAFEAVCFWHSDIVLTPQIRALTPDNELVYDRSAVSQRHFHPYRAFKALGISDPGSILEIYLAAFTGHNTPIHGTDDHFARNLARKAVQLYVVHSRSLPALFGELKRHQSFDAFARRFCARDGIPSLFAAPFDPGAETFDYCRWVSGDGLAAIGSSDEALLSTVQARRRVQTRAYHALQLQTVLQTGGLHYRKRGVHTGKAVAQVLCHIDSYLDDLEQALLQLCRKAPLSGVMAHVAAADQRYEDNIRRRLGNIDAWMASRKLIIAPTPSNIRSGCAVVIGCEKWVLQAPVRAIDKLVSLLVGEYLPRIANNLSSHSDAQRDFAVVCNTASRLLRSYVAFKQDTTRGRPTLSGFIGKFLRLDPVRSIWSVELRSVSPASGKFRELSFIFE